MADMDEVDDLVKRWTNTKMSWRDRPGTVLRPGTYGLNEMTDQMNIATAEMFGVFGIKDPLWWESLAELANLAKTQLYKDRG